MSTVLYLILYGLPGVVVGELLLQRAGKEDGEERSLGTIDKARAGGPGGWILHDSTVMEGLGLPYHDQLQKHLQSCSIASGGGK